jgi:hypothetical protein
VAQAVAPLPPSTSTVNPVVEPLFVTTTIVPPAPPPPPPSLSGAGPVVPLAEIVPVPLRALARIKTMPPPTPPDDCEPAELLRVPAPPPPPITRRPTAAAPKAVPPKPPRVGDTMSFNGSGAQLRPPMPPAPPLPPPPPPVLRSLTVGLVSLPPPPALPGAPRELLPLG